MTDFAVGERVGFLPKLKEHSFKLRTKGHIIIFEDSGHVTIRTDNGFTLRSVALSDLVKVEVPTGR